MKNPPSFTPNPSARFFSGRMQYAPTRVRAKFGGFHISAYEYVKNAPDFILSNKDAPKTHPISSIPIKDAPKTSPVLHPNRRRGTFWGVCNTPLHGYVHNSSSFIFPHPDTPKTHPILPFPIGIHRKPTRFYAQSVGEVF